MRYLKKYDCYIDDDCEIYVEPKNKDRQVSCALRHLLPRKLASDKYWKITIRGKTYSYHSVITYAFHGPRPEGYVIDHIDRNKDNNNPNNLRYCSQSENIANRPQTDLCIQKFGMRRIDDIKEWARRWRKANPDKVKATNHKSYYKHRSNGEAFRLCPDGHRRWVKVQ